MTRVGVWFVVFGLLGLALPHFGYDLTWFETLGSARDAVAVALIVVGLALVVVRRVRKTSRT